MSSQSPQAVLTSKTSGLMHADVDGLAMIILSHLPRGRNAVIPHGAVAKIRLVFDVFSERTVTYCIPFVGLETFSFRLTNEFRAKHITHI